MPTRLADGQYYGRVLRRRAVAGLILTETHYAPFAHVPRHTHANAYVCLVRRGSFTETYGRRTRTCGPWTLAFHPPEETHAEHFHAGEGLSFNVELPPAWLRRAAPAAELLERSPDFHGGPLAGLADRLYHEFRQPAAFPRPSPRLPGGPPRRRARPPLPRVPPARRTLAPGRRGPDPRNPRRRRPARPG